MIEIFSPLEHKVIVAVKNNKNSHVTDLANDIYKGVEPPISPGSVVGSTIRRINGKCERYNLTWCIEGENSGRNGKVVKIIKRDVK